MKHILFIMFILLGEGSNYQETQFDISEKIIGQWIVTRAKVSEKSATGVAVDRQLEIPQKATIYFKSDNTGNFNFLDRDSEKFTWKIVKNKMSITYTGNNEFCKSFNGDVRTVIRDRKGEQKMEMSKANFSASLSR